MSINYDMPLSNNVKGSLYKMGLNGPIVNHIQDYIYPSRQAWKTVFSNTLHLDQNVIVKIKATDIIISTIIPDKLSSLNYLKTNIEEVVFQKGLACLILNYEKNTIKALLTKKSYIKLNIKKGMHCYAIIKALNINDVININLV